MNAFTITSRVLLMTSVVNSTLNLWAQATGARGPAQPSTPPKTQLQRSTASSIGWRARQGQYYQRNFGIDILGVERVSSGEMLAFRYVVLDPEKAQAFNDKRNSAYLIDEKTGAKLTVPQMKRWVSCAQRLHPNQAECTGWFSPTPLESSMPGPKSMS